ncbi:MAG: MFS family permease [Glaciecola sp.]
MSKPGLVDLTVAGDWRPVRRTYLLLTLLSTLAASFIWGVNTLFLLDAGLSNTEAFSANAFFTLGMVVFEIPTGVVADTRGRRLSYLFGAATLFVSTMLYLLMWQIQAPFWAWAAASMVLGLGFTFFSGAVEAWLVDALDATGYTGELETVLARGQSVSGVAMLVGSVSGGALAQATNLGVPYAVRGALLLLTLAVASVAMRDLGFEPDHSRGPLDQVKHVVANSIESGWRNQPVRWFMLEAPFSAGVGVFAFYAMQPYLLELYGDSEAYGVAGLAAAIVAGAQIVGGFLVPYARRVFRRRTDALALGAGVSAFVLLGIGMTDSFAVAIALLVLWSLVFTITRPLRAAFVNGEIPSAQRATVLSADALMGSAGGVLTQPALGRIADVSSYSLSYVVGAGIQLGAIPFVLMARRTRAASDPIKPSAS